MVGAIIRVGDGKSASEEITRLLEAKDRGMAPKSAPAHGLYLHDVEYPDFVFDHGACSRALSAWMLTLVCSASSVLTVPHVDMRARACAHVSMHAEYCAERGTEVFHELLALKGIQLDDDADVVRPQDLTALRE